MKFLLTFVMALSTFCLKGQINQSSVWTHLKGDSSFPFKATYGIKGVKSHKNKPGGRSSPAVWTDSAGNIWIFGGLYSNGESTDLLNDLWKFDISVNQWVWVHGSNSINGNGVYGTIGIANTGNIPGARFGSVYWKDSIGNFYLFGGRGFPVTGTFGNLNDLWKYNPSTNEWTWQNGDKTTNVAGGYGTQGIMRPTNKPGGRYYSISWQDSAGNVWIFGGSGQSATSNGNLNDLWKYNPSVNQWVWMKGDMVSNQAGKYGTQGQSAPANNPGARYCAAAWYGIDNNLWLLGGSGFGLTGNGDLNDLWKFNPSTNEWTWVKGANTTNHPGSYGTMGVADVANNPKARYGSTTWRDSAGNLYLFAGNASPFGAQASSLLNDLWRYNPLSHEWTWIKGGNTSNRLGIYGVQGLSSVNNMPGSRVNPLSVKGPDEKIFVIGGLGYSSLSGDLALNSMDDFWQYDISTNEWVWLRGQKEGYFVPQYGVKGIPNPSNHPGPRSNYATWSDKEGNLWLFGGVGWLHNEDNMETNDLWKYNSQTNNWTWVKGDTLRYSTGYYGTKGAASDNNLPSVRVDAQSWTDTAGRLWLFGGSSNGLLLSDLWVFTPSTNQWMWVHGDSTANKACVYGTQGISSANNKPGGRKGCFTWIDPNNNLWMYGGIGYNDNASGGLNDFWKYNIISNEWTWVGGTKSLNVNPVYGIQGVADPSVNPGTKHFGGSWVDDSANLWLFGGNGWDAGAGNFNTIWKYNPQTNQWAWVKGDKARFVLGRYGQKGIADSVNTPSCRAYFSYWRDSADNFWIFGDHSATRNDLWKYDLTTNFWTWVNGDTTTGNYGSYGIPGIGTAQNKPGGRTSVSTWKDAKGNFFLYSGAGYGTNGNTYFNPVMLTDIWMYGSSKDRGLKEVALCAPVSSTDFFTDVIGTTFQWQVDTGSGYFFIFDGNQYSGSQTEHLTVTNLSSRAYSYKYRCIVNGTADSPFIIKFANNWTGNFNQSWENPANWSCGKVPDENTDVYIKAGSTVISNSTTTIGSLTILPGATLIINGGHILTVVR